MPDAYGGPIARYIDWRGAHRANLPRGSRADINAGIRALLARERPDGQAAAGNPEPGWAWLRDAARRWRAQTWGTA